MGLRLAIKLMDDDKGSKRPFDLKKEAAHDLAWLLAEQNIAGTEALKALKENQTEGYYRDYRKYGAMKAIRTKKFPEAESLIKELRFEQEKAIDYPQYTFISAATLTREHHRTKLAIFTKTLLSGGNRGIRS